MSTISFQKRNFKLLFYYFPYCVLYLNWYWILFASSAIYLYGGNPYVASVTLFNNTPLKLLYWCNYSNGSASTNEGYWQRSGYRCLFYHSSSWRCDWCNYSPNCNEYLNSLLYQVKGVGCCNHDVFPYDNRHWKTYYINDYISFNFLILSLAKSTSFWDAFLWEQSLFRISILNCYCVILLFGCSARVRVC